MISFAEQLAASAGVPIDKIGVVIVDHGSRRSQSNELLKEVVNRFATQTQLTNVQAAHMELAAPSIADAFQAAVEQGAELVVVFPYFLSPGRHWNQDIPQLAAEAAKHHPTARYLVTSPLGLHPAMICVMQDRITQCLDHAGGGEACDLCVDSHTCQLQGGR